MPRHALYRPEPAGFTMIEVMLSVMIMAFVLTMVYSAFSAGGKATRHGSDRAQIFHSARMAMQDIVRSIENIEFGTNDGYAVIGKPGGGIAPRGGAIGCDDLEFACVTQPALIDGNWQAGLARVRYQISGGGDAGPRLEKLVTRIDDEMFEDAYVIELSGNIVGMTFRYFDENGYEDSWDSDVKERLPETIEITLYAQEGDSVHALRSGAMIPAMMVRQGGEITAGGSSLNSGGRRRRGEGGESGEGGGRGEGGVRGGQPTERVLPRGGARGAQR